MLYEAGYRDVAVRGIVETSRSVASLARGSSELTVFEGEVEDQKDGRRGRYVVHEDGFVIAIVGPEVVEDIGRRFSDGATARACCSKTSRAL